MSKNLFYKSLFTKYYTLDNKIMTIMLANIFTIGYSFSNKKFTKEYA